VRGGFVNRSQLVARISAAQSGIGA
jgi:hypothetical protein